MCIGGRFEFKEETCAADTNWKATSEEMVIPDVWVGEVFGLRWNFGAESGILVHS